MVTRAKFIYARKIHKHFAPIPVLEIWNDFYPKKERCLIYKFHNGIATLVAYSVNSLETLSNLVEGCFEKESNFKKVLFQAFELPSNTLFIGLRVIYKGTIVLITHYSKKDFIGGYYAAQNLPRSEIIRTIEALPRGDCLMFGLPKKAFVRKTYRAYVVQTKIDQISESTEFVFKSSEEKVLWQHWENLLKYPEDAGLYITVIPFAKRFALWMQYLMTKCDKPIYDIANYAMKSGHMDSIDFVTLWRAVEVLSQSWKYGDELSNWFEKKYKLPINKY